MKSKTLKSNQKRKSSPTSKEKSGEITSENKPSSIKDKKLPSLVKKYSRSTLLRKSLSTTDMVVLPHLDAKHPIKSVSHEEIKTAINRRKLVGQNVSHSFNTPMGSLEQKSVKLSKRFRCKSLTNLLIIPKRRSTHHQQLHTSLSRHTGY
jgi:hypothetical protein